MYEPNGKPKVNVQHCITGSGCDACSLSLHSFAAPSPTRIDWMLLHHLRFPIPQTKENINDRDWDSRADQTWFKGVERLKWK
jgi:hypothetical protein